MEKNKESSSKIVVAMLAKQLNKPVAEVTPAKRIKEDLRADSLDIVDLIMNIEEKFDITVSDDAVETIKTVGDLIAFIEKIEKK